MYFYIGEGLEPRLPYPYICKYGVTHVMIVACYHPLPLSACMLNFDLVSILSGTSIPTSFNILLKMFLHLFHWFLLCVAACINLLAFVLPPLHTYEDSQQLAVTPTSCLVRILHTEYNSGSSYGNS